jgi:hypothetical protein
VQGKENKNKIKKERIPEPESQHAPVTAPSAPAPIHVSEKLLDMDDARF